MDLNEADHHLTVDYKGVQIGLHVSGTPEIALTIDGMVRSRKQSIPGKDVFLGLSSSVQTDYEWHEFIEATALFTETEVQVTIQANKSKLLEQTIELQGLK